MTGTEKHIFFERITWDTTISPEDVESVLSGAKDKVGYYDKFALFTRILESYPWFTLIDFFTHQQLKELLSEEVIQQIRSASLRHQYEFVRKRLQEII